MDAISYLYQTMLKNRIIRAFKKPITYIYLVFGALYAGMLLFGWDKIIESLKVNTPEGLTLVLTLFMLLIVPANMLTYAKRKGLIFKTSDVHLMFPAPIQPKLILIAAQLRAVFLGAAFSVIVVFIGVFSCGMPLWKMLLWYLFTIILENVFEASLVVLLYGNETLSDRMVRIFCGLIYALFLFFACFAFYLYLQTGVSLAFVEQFLSHPVIQCIPVVGWNIALIRLLLLGPTTLNVICTVFYTGSVLAVFLLAFRMKCTGGYFEDAMKFAEDYEEARQKNKKGETARIGKKEKYKKADILYRGTNAGAIFYRQLLEYKKSRFFIFGMQTIICLAAGIFAAVYAYRETNEYGVFILAGIEAYISLILSGYATKWTKELANPLTYLIPDTAARKLWYSTKMEHIRSFIDACLLTLPGAVLFRISFWQEVLLILLYIFLQANKLYVIVLSEALVGNLLGTVGKQLMRMVFQVTAIGIAILGGALFGFLYGIEAGFLVMILVTGLLTLCISLLASKLFEKMEAVN